MRLDLPSGSFAVKRLAAAFSHTAQLIDYLKVVFEYVRCLSDAGIKVFPTFHTSIIDTSSGSIVVYIVQQLFDSRMMLDKFLHRATEKQSRQCFEMIARHVDSLARKYDERVGLDAQVSNWFVELEDGPEEESKRNIKSLHYFDVTTPFMRAQKGGKEQIDVNVFLCSLPLPVRLAVRTFMLKDVIDKYYYPRGILLDSAGNLIKERLPTQDAIEIFNKTLGIPLTNADVTQYYEGDKGTWSLLQRLRKADKFFQEWICGRVYPFLLPGEIKR